MISALLGTLCSLLCLATSHARVRQHDPNASLTSALPAVRDADFEGLKLFIYELPSDYNSDLLGQMQLWSRREGSNCDFMLSPCAESRWAGKTSQARQRGAEVVILRKLLAAPSRALTRDWREADLFVVPWLCATDCLLGGFERNCLRTRSGGPSALLPQLRHYSPTTRHRHLFLATADMHSLPLAVASQTLLVTRGAYWGERPGHFVVPSAVPEADLALATGPRDILLWLTHTPNSAVRRLVHEHVSLAEQEPQRLRSLGLSGRVVLRGTERGAAASMPAPAAVLAEMRRAQFCPAPPAENPSAGTKRLLDALLAGCVPVVVAFATRWGSGVSWWRHDGVPLEWSMPFAQQLDWRRLVVEVRSEALVVEDGLIRALAGVGKEALAAKRRYISEVRGGLLYDLRGGTRDAFSLLMEGIRDALPRLSAHTPVVCDAVPLTATPRRVQSSSGSMLEKAWGHAFSEVACAPAQLWQPPAASARGRTTPIALQQHMAVQVARWPSGTSLVTLEQLMGLVAEGEHKPLLAAAHFSSCSHVGFLEACHDEVDMNEEGQVKAVALCRSFPRTGLPNTTCRLLPPPPPLPHPAPGEWELAVHVSSSAQLQALKRWLGGADGPLRAFAYQSSHRALVEHVLTVAYAQQSGQVTSEVLVLASSFEEIALVQLLASRRAFGGSWLLALGRREAREHVCEAYTQLISAVCPVPAEARAIPPLLLIAFTSELLRSTPLSLLELAGAGLVQDTRAQLHLLFALLMQASQRSGASAAVEFVGGGMAFHYR